MDPADFTDRVNWCGGFYELAIDLGLRKAAGSTKRLVTALRAIWAEERLDGCYSDRSQPRAAQVRTAPHLAGSGQLYGVATLPTGQATVCASTVIREDSFGKGVDHDWVVLCLPLGALERIHSDVGSYPFGDTEGSFTWREPIDDWLVEVARRVHAVASFQVAFIGAEVSGEPFADIGSEVPAERWFGYVVPDADGGVVYFAANR